MKANLNLDLSVALTGRAVRNDYGVPGSPVWYDVEDVEIDTAWFLDREWTGAEFEAEFGKLAEWIINDVKLEDFEDEV